MDDSRDWTPAVAGLWLMRTADGYSKIVSAGNGMFTLLGIHGDVYRFGDSFLFLVRREIEHGPWEVAAGHKLVPARQQILVRSK